MPLLAGTDAQETFIRVSSPLVYTRDYAEFGYKVSWPKFLTDCIFRASTSVAKEIVDKSLYLRDVRGITFFQSSLEFVGVSMDLSVRQFKDKLTTDELFYWGNAFRDRILYEVAQRSMQGSVFVPGMMELVKPSVSFPSLWGEVRRLDDLRSVMLSAPLDPMNHPKPNWIVKQKSKVKE